MLLTKVFRYVSVMVKITLKSPSDPTSLVPGSTGYILENAKKEKRILVPGDFEIIKSEAFNLEEYNATQIVVNIP